MSDLTLHKVNKLRGELTIPGDKSISHRSIMLGAIAKGDTHVTGFLDGADCRSTISCFRKMGIEIDHTEGTDEVLVRGKGLHGLTAPTEILDTGNSGTTTRLISGILAAQDFSCEITGDASIQRRPMGRIMTPLSMMGAEIKSVLDNDCAPFRITGTKLHGIHYDSPVASAQVKSAILFAGLYADGETSVTEPALSRNHSELMLSAYGADVTSAGTTATVRPAKELFGQEIHVPGDISSAAYFLAAGLLIPGSEITVRHVGINPTRDGILRVIHAMGGEVKVENEHTEAGEPTADLTVSYCPLHGTVIEGDLIPTLIDEIPIIAVLAAFAEGETVIRDAKELKVKESNRIDVMVENLSAMGADIEATEDGMIIRGGKPLHGAAIHSHLDHRIAMSFAIAALATEGDTVIRDADCVNISYPTFYEDLKKLQA